MQMIYLVLQFLKTNHFFSNQEPSQPNKGKTMIKDIIEETTISIESKITGLFFSLLAGLTITAVLAYGVIKLIWYFEGYLLLNYGTSYAVFFICAVVAIAVAPLVYTKYYYSAKAEELEHQRKVATELVHAPQRGGLGDIMAMPEKIMHQAFMGFLDGLRL